MRQLAAGLLVLGIADLVWINVSLGPQAFSDPAPPEQPAVAVAAPVPEPAPEPVPAPAPAPVPEPPPALEPQPKAEPAPDPPPPQEPEPPPTRELPAPATVVFDVGKTKLDQAAEDELANAIATLAANPELRVELAGHADARGPDITNYKLGLRRARAVQAHLVRNGVDKDRITAYSAGERRPVSRADDEEAFRLNRRVEVTIYQEDDR